VDGVVPVEVEGKECRDRLPGAVREVDQDVHPGAILLAPEELLALEEH
jgi:hypothetical protein